MLYHSGLLVVAQSFLAAVVPVVRNYRLYVVDMYLNQMDVVAGHHCCAAEKEDYPASVHSRCAVPVEIVARLCLTTLKTRSLPILSTLP